MYNNYSDSGGHGSHNNNNVALSSAAASSSASASASVTSPSSGDGGSPPAVAIHKNKEQTAQVGVLQELAREWLWVVGKPCERLRPLHLLQSKDIIMAHET